MYKIFIFTGSFQFGGTEQYLKLLCRHLNPGMFHATVGAFSDDGPFVPETAQKPAIFPFGRFYKIPQNIIVLLDLIKYIRRERFHLLYSTHYQTNVYLSIASLFCQGSVFISGYRGLYPNHGKIDSLFNRFITARSRKIIVNSNASGRVLRERTGTALDKIRVIHNGRFEKEGYPRVRQAETGRLQTLRERCRSKTIIGTVGRLQDIKGQRFLIEAFSRLCRRHENARLLIVGDGEERKSLEKLAATLCVSDKVHFTGYILDVGPVLDLLDLFVLPSESESFPNALLEAMDRGLACIATHVGGIPEIIEDSVNGILVPPCNPEAIYEETDRLLVHEQLRISIARNAKKTAQGFTVENMVKQVEAVFKEEITRSDICRQNSA